MTPKDDPRNEGHTREWQDRARVVLKAKKDAQAEASPNQSPLQGAENQEDAKEKIEKVKDKNSRDPDAFY